ncbi:MAG: pyridoxine 5'-phosphate synthase, partial [SAR324 cluster bacterium]|nr:pyridoxine 5'-phosphate synthase [SAR324 cluster bacterium]
MIALHVNVDHVATVRQARRASEPDPVTAAALAEVAGANGITVHLREDRRHIQDRDVRVLRETVQTVLNLEMATTAEMLKFAIQIHPEVVTLVPEKREEVTTEGGLDVVGGGDDLRKAIGELRDKGMRVSLFIDPDIEQIQSSAKFGASDIELHTGPYAHANANTKILSEAYQKLENAALEAHRLGLQVNAGHGLTYQNTQLICHLPHLREL